MSPSLFVSKSIKNFEGAQCNSPGTRSPLKYPSLTRFDSDGGKTGTMARIKSAGVIKVSPEGVLTDAKYSKTWKANMVHEAISEHFVKQKHNMIHIYHSNQVEATILPSKEDRRLTHLYSELILTDIHRGKT